ncbi:MAG: molybdopterin converting factor subunit 1 [Gammaproteobacteria bacterium]
MSIKVRYFASLKESLGRSEEVVEVDNSLTARELWAVCITDKNPPDNVLVAINMNYAEWDSAVTDGDEVAFFPPVTGG